MSGQKTIHHQTELGLGGRSEVVIGCREVCVTVRMAAARAACKQTSPALPCVKVWFLSLINLPGSSSLRTTHR